MALLHSEWVLKAGCIKPMNVSRYSDAVVLISQLSKSCSCGIKTDTVPVSDLGGEKEKKKKVMRKIIIPTKVCIDFTCPDHEAG